MKAIANFQSDSTTKAIMRDTMIDCVAHQRVRSQVANNANDKEAPKSAEP